VLSQPLAFEHALVSAALSEAPLASVAQDWFA